MRPPHYFSHPNGPSMPTEVNMILGGRPVAMLTDRGVFSRTSLDRGTRILLEVVPTPPSEGHLLDLGCGYGPIAVAMAFASPAASIWAIDVNPRARALCQHNCEALGVANVRVCTPDDVPDDITLSCIWSNPPMRIGKAAVRELLTRWLPRLALGSSAHLVVQRHLGADSMHAWLTSAGWTTTRLASRNAYRVLKVSAGPPTPDREGNGRS